MRSQTLTLAAVVALGVVVIGCSPAEQQDAEIKAEAAGEKAEAAAAQAGEVIESGAMKAARALEQGAGNVAEQLEANQAEAAAQGRPGAVDPTTESPAPAP